MHRWVLGGVAVIVLLAVILATREPAEVVPPGGGPTSAPTAPAERPRQQQTPTPARPTPTSEPARPTSTVASIAHSRSCDGYSTWEWAQTVYESNPARYAGLDQDGDSIACPNLPHGMTPSIWASIVPAGAERVSLHRVIDGDTAEFVLRDGTVADVRFILIDTPETVAPNQPVGCYGQEASALLSQILTRPADIYLERDVSETDRYGRLLRYVWLDFNNGYVWLVNETIARTGHGQLSTFPPDVKYVDQVGAGVEFARRHQLGLWGACGSFGEPVETPTPIPRPAPRPTRVPPSAPACDPSYPTLCLPPGSPDLDCGDINASSFPVYQPDPHGLDGDFDGIGCEPAPPPAPPPAQPPAQPPQQPGNCDPSYPTLCLPSFPDLDCGEITARRFPVVPPDPHGFDGDFDGIGCESG